MSSSLEMDGNMVAEPGYGHGNDATGAAARAPLGECGGMIEKLERLEKNVLDVKSMLEMLLQRERRSELKRDLEAGVAARRFNRVCAEFRRFPVGRCATRSTRCTSPAPR